MARNILVVEDDNNISDLIRMYLEKEGFEVRIAADGGKAVEEFKAREPDLVLLDVMLPVLDGWGVCAKIRETSKCPIIMLTAKGEVNDRIHGLEMGADDYVVKPFEMKELLARINAVLRRTAAADVSEADFADPLDRLSIYYCLSRPVAELFYAQFGEEAFPLAAAFYEKPKTTIRVNTLRTNDTALTALLQQEGHTVTPGPWPGALVVEFAGSPAASAAFKKGLFHVQGLASQFAALCVDAQPGQQVLDLCAAPGGKSLTLAEAMQDKGQLVSGEFVPARVPLLQQAFDRCGITCAVAVENDATQHNSDWPTFDRVLCDVPCSGLGVIAKKPDIRYKDLDGIENLLAAQQKILQNGADSLAENGRLVYSTCTVNDKENQAQVEKFLSANPDFHVVLPKTALPGADITPLGTLFLPHRTGTDGFFAAILERN